MTHAKRLWSIWQALLSAFAWAFTGPSFRRFAEWVTAMAITARAHHHPSILSHGLVRSGKGNPAPTTAPGTPTTSSASLTRLVETAPGRLWHG